MRRPSRLPNIDSRLLNPERWVWIALAIDVVAVFAAVFLCVASFEDADAALVGVQASVARPAATGATLR